MRTIVINKLLINLAIGLCLLVSPALAESDILGLPAYPAAKSHPFKGKLHANSVPMETSMKSACCSIPTA